METVATDATAKAQAFAHRLVEFADFEACVKFFDEREIDFDRPNDMGWSVLMSVCACGRDDLVGFVVDRTNAVDCATNSNWTTVLHLTAMSKNTRVMEELVATTPRREKLQKIIEQANVQGDTALMMACVAKNTKAVQLLLELGASTSAVNVSGLNALMCAARVGEDPRPGAPSIDEMMERSAAILKTLLAHGADVNAVERAGGNTALHLAVLSENPSAVESLLTNAPDLDITLRNEAGNTALDLSKRISGVASAQMEDLLNVKWAQYEREAAQLSSKVEQELMYLAVKEAEDAAGRNQAIKMKTGKKKNKKYRQKAKIPDNTLVKEAEATSVEQDEVEAILEETNIDTSSELIAKVELEQSARGLVQELDNDKDNWQSVLPNKSRRKETAKETTKARRGVSKNQHKGCTKKKTANKNSNRNPPQSAHETSAKVPKQISPSSTTPKAPWASQTITSSANPPSPRSQVTSEEDEDETVSSDNSYERLNRSFQRTFPVAAELEIDVEKFLIASSVSDRELEPNASLSISQVEALQEAHWQAYHYLNEKKIELTRVLEAQRVEAQFVLQQELMQMK